MCVIFTDIQSSTLLWNKVGEQMAKLLDIHGHLIRKLIGKHKCYEVKTVGDSFMVVTADPVAGVKLCIAIQVTFPSLPSPSLPFTKRVPPPLDPPAGHRFHSGGKIYKRKYWPFVVHKLLCSRPPPPPPLFFNTSLVPGMALLSLLKANAQACRQSPTQKPTLGCTTVQYIAQSQPSLSKACPHPTSDAVNCAYTRSRCVSACLPETDLAWRLIYGCRPRPWGVVN